MKNFIYILAILTVGAVGYLFFMKGQKQEPSKPQPSLVIENTTEDEEYVEEASSKNKVVVLPETQQKIEAIEERVFNSWDKKVRSFLEFTLKKEAFVVNKYFTLRKESEDAMEEIESSHKGKSDSELDEILTQRVDKPYQIKIKALLGDEDYDKYKKLRNEFNAKNSKKYPKYRDHVLITF